MRAVLYFGANLLTPASGATGARGCFCVKFGPVPCIGGWPTRKALRTGRGAQRGGARHRNSLKAWSEIGGAAERGQAARRRLQASQQAGWGTHAEAWSMATAGPPDEAP